MVFLIVQYLTYIQCFVKNLEEKEKLQASSRGTSERGRGGGRGGHANGRDGRSSNFQDRDRDFRGGNFERGGRGGGRGRGGPGGRPDRTRDPRDENRPKDENRFKERKDNPRGRDQPDTKVKKDGPPGPANGRGPPKGKGQVDNKAPRFQNQKYVALFSTVIAFCFVKANKLTNSSYDRPALQHESSRYLGHAPSSSVSTNSTLGQGSSDWGASLARKVDMMSLIDCDNTPDEDPSYTNGSSWSNK